MKEVLKILEENARTSCAQIAKMTGLSEEQVQKLLKEYEKSGAIIKYKTLIDWEKAGEEKVYAFIEVKVTPERDVGFDQVARRIYRFPEVHSLYLLSGAFDLLVVIEGKSMKEIAYFVAEKLATIEQVQSTSTHFVLKKYKVDGQILEVQEPLKREPLSL
jgi:DNA-binding Lrp family transcriptional regulator